MQVYRVSVLVYTNMKQGTNHVRGPLSYWERT